MNNRDLLRRIESDWHTVSARRGIPLPDRSGTPGLLGGISGENLSQIRLALEACAKNREVPRDLDVLGWAAKCTKPAFLTNMVSLGVACTGVSLFQAGVHLMGEGWDVSARAAQLKSNPVDVESLRAAVVIFTLAAVPDSPVAAAAGDPAETRLPETSAAGEFNMFASAVQADQGSTEPSFVETEEPPFVYEEPETDRPESQSVAYQRLRLYAKGAAHTLEVGPHRRGRDFLGVHVVSIDSAYGLGGGKPGYDWQEKLSMQLTPEEMPLVLSVLMNIRSNVRLDYHGPARDKFVEFRWKDSGLIVTTGKRSHPAPYTVPVPAASVYFLLQLFCVAMCKGQIGLRPGDVLAMAGSMNGA